MCSLQDTPAEGGYRQPGGKALVFTILLALVMSTLGIRASSESAASGDLAGPAKRAVLAAPAAPAEFTTPNDDGTQGATPTADSDVNVDVNVDDNEGDGDGEGDSDGDGEGSDHIKYRPEISLSLPPLSASTRSGAWSTSLYRSFVSEPSTPPPRA